MGYQKISNHIIKIGKSVITLSEKSTIDKIQELNDKIIFNTSPSEIELDWSKIETHAIWKERVTNNPPCLYVYNKDGNLLWEFKTKDVVGYEIELPENKTELDFISPEHFKKYMKEYSGKDILIVYAGDFRYRVDCNTGEIYGKNESR